MEIPAVTQETADKLIGYIRSIVQRTGCERAVIGLSGGIDSAVVTKLAIDALGSEKVTCMYMPAGTPNKDDEAAVESMRSEWNMELRTIDVEPCVDAFLWAIDDEQGQIDIGNFASRSRMTILYNIARRTNGLVFGTSNLSERRMGYFTKYGDGASDVAPISGLFKTQVKQLAEIIGIPRDIIDKPPSAGFWEGQTDEDEMGVTYADLDKVLFGIDKGMTDREIAEDVTVGVQKIAEIRKRVVSMEHKIGVPYRP